MTLQEEMKTYYFIRHGETEYNKKGIIQGSGVDSSLNDTGIKQAEAFYLYYQHVGFDHIICSQLQRSYQTILPFVAQRQLAHERTALINEISWGIHEGQSGSLELRERYQRMVEAWSNDDLDHSLPQAESARQLAQRSAQFLTYLVTLPYKQVLICTHGRTLRCLLCLMKGQHLREMESYDHSNTGLFVAKWSKGDFILELENDLKHLDHL